MNATQAPEQWQSIPGYEGLYEVSDRGRVRSLDRTVEHAVNGHRSIKGRVLSQTGVIKGLGYKKVALSKDGEIRTKTVHALVMLAFVGHRPPGMDVCHYNGDPSDNQLENLRYDTRKANHDDRFRHGTRYRNKTHCPQGHPYEGNNIYRAPSRAGLVKCRTCMSESARRKNARRRAENPGPGKPRGTRVAGARLTPAAVREIRSRYESGQTCQRIAADYPVSESGIYAVVTRKSWRHVE